MKYTDLGIVMIHWMMVVILLSTAITGICLWEKGVQQYVSLVFKPDNIGVIHIGLSVAVVAIFLIHIGYLRYKNWLSRIALNPRLIIGGQVQWKYVNILLYWVLFTTVVIETFSGILLTKLIDKEVLARVFGIEKGPLIILHLWLVLPIFAFPVLHFTVHYMDRKVLSIFRPKVFARRPSMATIMAKLKKENVRLKSDRKESHR